ncbi:hypothetical protein [Halomonas shantousis]
MTVKDNAHIRGVVYFLFLFIFVMVYRGLSLQDVADDAYYITVLDDRTLWDFIQSRYQEWSGRTLLEAIMVSTIRFPVFWKVAIPASLLFLFYQIWKLTLKHHFSPHFGSLVVAFFMFMLSGQVAAWGAWWITGFYNYLLPVVLGVYGFCVVVNKHGSSLFFKSLGALAIVTACQQEQVAIALIASLSAVMIYRKILGEKVFFEFLVLLLGIVSACFLFLAPGNYYRFQSEISWLPEFLSMSLWEKLMLGVDRVNAHVSDDANNIFLIAVVMTFLVTCSKDRSWRMKPLAIALLGFFIFNSLLSQTQLSHFSGKLRFTEFIGPENWYDYDIFISYALTLLIYGVMACCAIYISDSCSELLQYFGVLTLSFGVIMALAFSPTIYASGPRILYLPDVLLVIYSCLVLSKMMSGRKPSIES